MTRLKQGRWLLKRWLRGQAMNADFRHYPQAQPRAIDYAMLAKIYGETAEAEKRYGPAECIGCQKKPVTGSPDPKHISTSYCSGSA